MAKTIWWIQHTQKNKTRKNGEKDGKALYKLMNNALYGMAIENVRKRINVKLVKKKKRLFKADIQTKKYFTQNAWH